MEQQEISIFPERTVVYGNFGQRLGALIIDGLVIGIPNAIIQKLIGGNNYIIELREEGTLHSTTMLSLAISLLVPWLYEAAMTSSEKQGTVGKMAVGLKVTDLQGNRISFARATGRHFAKNLSALIILIGYFMMLWDDKAQTLHDKLAGTLVVKTDPGS